jgi:hypothetical protein
MRVYGYDATISLPKWIAAHQALVWLCFCGSNLLVMGASTSRKGTVLAQITSSECMRMGITLFRVSLTDKEFDL